MSRIMRILLPRCEASTRLLVSSVGASGALHAIAAIVIVAVFGTVSANLLPPPHGRNSIQLTASVIVVDAVEPPLAEPPTVTTSGEPRPLALGVPDLAEPPSISIAASSTSPLPEPDTAGLKPVHPAAGPFVDVTRRISDTPRRDPASSDLPPLPATDATVSKRPSTRMPSSAVASPASTANAGQLDEIPATIHSPRPEYPAAALAAGIEGRVVLRIDLSRRGEVTEAVVTTSSGHASLDEAARRAVRQWRFEPAARLGLPVATAIAVPVTFRIETD
jgi:protein TonB